MPRIEEEEEAVLEPVKTTIQWADEGTSGRGKKTSVAEERTKAGTLPRKTEEESVPEKEKKISPRSRQEKGKSSKVKSVLDR